MKRFKWWLMGLVVLCLAIVPLTGCTGVPQSELEALQADYEAAQAEQASLVAENTSLKGQLRAAQSDLTSAQADYEAVNQELLEIKEVYPPRDFSSLTELQDWLRANDVSERPPMQFAEDWYGKALAIQEDALRDGYTVSVDYDYYEETDEFGIFCITIIDGDVWYWDPETDEPLQDYTLGKVK